MHSIILLVSFSAIAFAADKFPLSGQIVLPGATLIPTHQHNTNATMLHQPDTDGAQAEYASLQLWVHLNNGRELTTYVKRDGSFVVHGIPAGTHMLSIDSPTYMFPTLRVDISAQRSGLPSVSLADDNTVKLPDPLVIRPAALASYFDQRRPFNAVAFLKSPIGIISGVGCGGVMWGVDVVVVDHIRGVHCMYATTNSAHGVGHVDYAQAQAGSRGVEAIAGNEGGTKARPPRVVG